MSATFYPSLFIRLKALLVDACISIALLFGAFSFFSQIGDAPDIWKIACIVFIFILYDPLFVSMFGGTIGHSVMGICVKRDADHSKNILFPVAVLRFLVKAFLGWISFISVTTNEQRKAAHDIITGSIVLYKAR